MNYAPSFILPPGLNIDQGDDQYMIYKDNFKVCSLHFDNSEQILLKTYDYSPEYGEKITCQKLIINFTHKLVSTFLNLN